MWKYKNLQILKHALQHYVQRDGASEKDLREENALLDYLTEKVERIKHRYDID